MKYLFRFTFWLAVLGCLAMVFGSCQAVKRNILTGGGTAAAASGGAVLGGPLGAGGAALIYYLVVANSTENQELRDGDIVGEEALRKQVALWKDKALAAAADRSLAEKVAASAERAAETAHKWLWRAIWLGVAYFIFRNRKHLLAIGPGYLSKLWHAISGFSALQV
jgi:hypothetical protein